MLSLLVVLGLVLVFGAMMYTRSSSSANYNVARNAAEKAAGAEATHIGDILKNAGR